MENTQEIQEWEKKLVDEFKKHMDYDESQYDDFVVELVMPFIFQKLKEQRESIMREIESKRVEDKDPAIATDSEWGNIGWNDAIDEILNILNK